MQVCNLTTPAQYFHVLRRQMKRAFKKPLIIMTPKSMLRLEAAASKIEDFTNDRFHEILPGPLLDKPEKVKRVILCSGKVYYDGGQFEGLPDSPAVAGDVALGNERRDLGTGTPHQCRQARVHPAAGKVFGNNEPLRPGGVVDQIIGQACGQALLHRFLRLGAGRLVTHWVSPGPSCGASRRGRCPCRVSTQMIATEDTTAESAILKIPLKLGSWMKSTTCPIANEGARNNRSVRLPRAPPR